MINNQTNITFAIPVYNEEKRMPLIIKNLKDYGRIVFLDGGSNDESEKIASKANIEFYRRPESSAPYVETKETVDFLFTKLLTEWFCWGYADNLIPKKTLEAIVEISKGSSYKIVYAPLHTYLWGFTKYPSHQSYIPILVHKDYINFSNARIHSMGDFTGTKKEKLYLPNTAEYAVQHFSVYNSRKFILGHMRYAETEAEEKHAAGKKFTLLRMFVSILYYMIIYGRYALRNGKIGILIVLHYATFRLMAFTRLFELSNNINLDTIGEKYQVEQEKFLTQFDNKVKIKSIIPSK